MTDLAYLGNRIFREPSEETGLKLQNWSEKSDTNPEELGDYAEGDILFPNSMRRNGLVGEASRWKEGVIPYEIRGPYSRDDLDIINKAISIYHKYTCLKFRKRQASDSDYVSIVNTNTGCWSSVGRIGGKQEVNLQSPSCTTKVGTALHELMHAAGFLHEQNRYERDDFVNIVWQNIKRGHEANFDKADKEKTDGFGVPYDYTSVMHYSSKAFSVNGMPTITAKDPEKAKKMGQRSGFSKGDLTKINKMYNCPEKTLQVVNSTTTEKPSNASTENKENPNLLDGFFSWLFHRK